MTILSVYTNCSLGGMGTVFRTRAKANPGKRYELVFTHDAGARGSLSGLENVDVRIVPKHRLPAYLAHATESRQYEEVGVTLLQDVLPAINRENVGEVVYEIHTPNEQAAINDVLRLDLGRVDKVRVPSRTWGNMINSVVDRQVEVEVVPNLIDTSVFREYRSTFAFKGRTDQTPLVWIGRFDSAKNPNDLLRALTALPEEYFGVFIVSLESDPARAMRFLSYVDALGLGQRVDIFLNLSPMRIANVMNRSRELGGVLCSTSLEESYGYAIAEGALCGLPVVSYEVGAVREHLERHENVELVPVGGVTDLVKKILDTSVQNSETLSI